eukprot:COSAG03_NODE_1533_length_3918_cov_64.898403_4_plen_31_part_01
MLALLLLGLAGAEAAGLLMYAPGQPHNVSFD